MGGGHWQPPPAEVIGNLPRGARGRHGGALEVRREGRPATRGGQGRIEGAAKDVS